MIELLHENLLPALDRCTIVLGNLEGLAEYYAGSEAFDVPISTFSMIHDIIRCIRLLGHHMLLLASQDQRRFASFSKWLRHEIEVQGSDPNSTAGQEIRGREVGVDVALVFAYIENALETSKVDAFLCDSAEAPDITVTPELYENVRKSLEAFKANKKKANKKKANKAYDTTLLKLPSYHAQWCKHNQTLIEQITNWQRSNTMIPGALVLSKSAVAVCDVRMVTNQQPEEADQQPEEALIWTYVAMAETDSLSSVSIYRILHSELFDDMVESVHRMEGVIIDLPDGGSVLDLKFADDEKLLVLVKQDKASTLLGVPLQPRAVDRPTFSFSAVEGSAEDMGWPAGRAPKANRWSLDSETFEAWTKARFRSNETFQPLSLDVNGRSKRRICVIVGEDLHQLQIRDLDSSSDERSRESVEELLQTLNAATMG
jgi:anaphase-promoting complex subunit 4